MHGKGKGVWGMDNGWASMGMAETQLPVPLMNHDIPNTILEGYPL